MNTLDTTETTTVDTVSTATAETVTENITLPTMEELKATPEEEAAGRYMYLLKVARRISREMSAKSIRRVLLALAEFPLQESEKPELKEKREHQLFQVIYEINAAKGIVLNYARKLEDERKSKAAEVPVAEKENNESKAE